MPEFRPDGQSFLHPIYLTIRSNCQLDRPAGDAQVLGGGGAGRAEGRNIRRNAALSARSLFGQGFGFQGLERRRSCFSKPWKKPVLAFPSLGKVSEVWFSDSAKR